MKLFDQSPPKNQSGIALFISAIFLLVLSIIGVAAMQDTAFDQKMATNHQKMMHAFQYAESGLARAVKDTGMFNSAYRDGASVSQSVDGISTSRSQSRDTHFCMDAQGKSLCQDSALGAANTRAYYTGVGKNPVVNSSTDRGLANHNFEIESVGRVQNIASTVRLGVSTVGPLGN